MVDVDDPDEWCAWMSAEIMNMQLGWLSSDDHPSLESDIASEALKLGLLESRTRDDPTKFKANDGIEYGWPILEYRFKPGVTRESVLAAIQLSRSG